MPPVGKYWLALTQEPALEPEMPICDPHHHFWDQRPERAPYDRYLLPELIEDISTHSVRCTVFVEAHAMHRADGPEEMRPVGEVEFVQGIAAASASGLYGPARAAAAIVGHADLTLGDRATPVLEAMQAASPNRFRGIRHSVTWDPNPGVDIPGLRPVPHLLMDSKFRAGAKVLARMGLSYDVWMYHPQLPELADFARAIPDLTIILNHVGGLNRTGPYANHDKEVMANWRSGIARVAECPNVVVKLGSVGTPRLGFDWHTRSKPVGSEEMAKGLGPIMNYCIEKFGPNRCMFESNFPVDKVVCSYSVLFNAFKRLSKGYSPSERAAMFHETAVRAYRVKA